MTRWGGGINVVFTIISSWASDERGVAVISNKTGAGDGESSSWRGSGITLPLGSGSGENTATTLTVGDATVVDAIGSSGEVAADAILPVRELSDGASLRSLCGEPEAAACRSLRNKSVGSLGKGES